MIITIAFMSGLSLFWTRRILQHQMEAARPCFRVPSAPEVVRQSISPDPIAEIKRAARIRGLYNTRALALRIQRDLASGLPRLALIRRACDPNEATFPRPLASVSTRSRSRLRLQGKSTLGRCTTMRGCLRSETRFTREN